MDERLERELRVGLAALLDSVVESHPRWETSPAAERVLGVPAQRWRSGHLTVLWAAALAAMLLAGLLAAAYVGGWRPDLAMVVAPSPTPAPTATAAYEAGTGILATTRARPLPAQATCPTGSDPNALGPADQERPSAIEAGSMAFDRRAGRIVLLADDFQIGLRTWTFDVCANTWERMSPDEEPPPGSKLVYDADSDTTAAITPDGEVLSYDMASDTWTRGGSFPEVIGLPHQSGGFVWRGGVAVLYHDPSGLIILYDGESMWAYDVDADTMVRVRQRLDPSRPAGSGAPDGTVTFSKLSVAYDARNGLLVAHVVPEEQGQPETWTFDPRTSTWRLDASAPTPEILLVGGYIWEEVGSRGVFDEAAGVTVFASVWGDRVGAYDASSGAWRTVYFDDGFTFGDLSWCQSMPPVYDALNARIVCRGGPSSGAIQDDGVSALSTATGQWRWLLPSASASPASYPPNGSGTPSPEPEDS
jgi:hypothetical protein